MSNTYNVFGESSTFGNPVVEDLDMNGHKITGTQPGTDPEDVATISQLTGSGFVPFPATYNYSMGGFKLTNNAPGSAIDDLLQKQQIETLIGAVPQPPWIISETTGLQLALDGKYDDTVPPNQQALMTGDLNMNDQRIVDLLDPIAPQQASTMAYTDAQDLLIQTQIDALDDSRIQSLDDVSYRLKCNNTSIDTVLDTNLAFSQSQNALGPIVKQYAQPNAIDRQQSNALATSHVSEILLNNIDDTTAPLRIEDHQSIGALYSTLIQLEKEQDPSTQSQWRFDANTSKILWQKNGQDYFDLSLDEINIYKNMVFSGQTRCYFGANNSGYIQYNGVDQGVSIYDHTGDELLRISDDLLTFFANCQFSGFSATQVQSIQMNSSGIIAFNQGDNMEFRYDGTLDGLVVERTAGGGQLLYQCWHNNGNGANRFITSYQKHFLDPAVVIEDANQLVTNTWTDTQYSTLNHTHLSSDITDLYSSRLDQFTSPNSVLSYSTAPTITNDDHIPNKKYVNDQDAAILNVLPTLYANIIHGHPHTQITDWDTAFETKLDNLPDGQRIGTTAGTRIVFVDPTLTPSPAYINFVLPDAASDQMTLWADKLEIQRPVKYIKNLASGIQSSLTFTEDISGDTISLTSFVADANERLQWAYSVGGGSDVDIFSIHHDTVDFQKIPQYDGVVHTDPSTIVEAANDYQLTNKRFVTDQVATKANVVHSHIISDTTGLQTALDSKYDDTTTLDNIVAPATSLNMNSHQIINLLAPTLDTDAATKKYVDDNSGGGGPSVTTFEYGQFQAVGTTIIQGGQALNSFTLNEQSLDFTTNYVQIGGASLDQFTIAAGTYQISLSCTKRQMDMEFMIRFRNSSTLQYYPINNTNGVMSYSNSAVQTNPNWNTASVTFIATLPAATYEFQVSEARNLNATIDQALVTFSVVNGALTSSFSNQIRSLDNNQSVTCQAANITEIKANSSVQVFTGAVSRLEIGLGSILSTGYPFQYLADPALSALVLPSYGQVQTYTTGLRLDEFVNPTAPLQYAAAQSFTLDSQLIDKKYVDDSFALIQQDAISSGNITAKCQSSGSLLFNVTAIGQNSFQQLNLTTGLFETRCLAQTTITDNHLITTETASQDIIRWGVPFTSTQANSVSVEIYNDLQVRDIFAQTVNETVPSLRAYKQNIMAVNIDLSHMRLHTYRYKEKINGQRMESGDRLGYMLDDIPDHQRTLFSQYDEKTGLWNMRKSQLRDVIINSLAIKLEGKDNQIARLQDKTQRMQKQIDQLIESVAKLMI